MFPQTHQLQRSRDDRRRDERKRREFDRHGKSSGDSHRERERHERRRGSPRGRSYSRSRSRSRSGSRGKSRDREHRGGRGEKATHTLLQDTTAQGSAEVPEAPLTTVELCVSDAEELLETDWKRSAQRSLRLFRTVRTDVADLIFFDQCCWKLLTVRNDVDSSARTSVGI